MKSNHQARHLLGLNYKLSRQKKWCWKAMKKPPSTTSMLPAANAAWLIFSLSDDKQHRPVAGMVFLWQLTACLPA